MFSKSATIAALLAIGSAVALDESNNNNNNNLRGSGSDEGFGQFACPIAGAAGQDTCDSSKDTDGSNCVWCSMASIGFCVSESQAEAIENKFPTVTCDGDSPSGGDDDDDDNAADDDGKTEDDDSTPGPSPDDYWKCLTSSKNEKTCSSAGCTWCMTHAGYGICLSADAAEQADKSDWFTCGSGDLGITDLASPLDASAGPFDTSCLVATLSGDEESCEATMDQDGEPCEWCTVYGQVFCLTSQQADIATEAGGQCGESSMVAQNGVSNPYDPSCVLATMSGDEDSCKATSDQGGEACEWCKIGIREVCLTSDQADILAQVGAQCSDSSSTLEEMLAISGDDDDESLFDPYDTSCVVASLSGDSGACQSTSDQDGQPCEWCTVGGYGICLTVDQADMAGQVGAECDAGSSAEEEIRTSSSPYDTSCLVASLEGDESTCESTMDNDGEPCQWCEVSSANLCLTPEQASIVTEIGASCSGSSMSVAEE